MMENKDFKYVMQDLTNIYVGAKYTYIEMLEAEETPFKLKTLVRNYILKEVPEDTTIEQHLFMMKDTDPSFLLFKQMKASFKVYVRDESIGKTGGYALHEYSVQQIVENAELHENRDDTVIQEMHLTKLGLLSVGL